MIKFILFLISINAMAETFTYKSDRSQSFFRETGTEINLDGNVRIQSDSFSLVGLNVKIFGENQRFIEGNGAIELEYKKQNLLIKSGYFFYDQKEKFVRLRGQVYIQDVKDGIIIQSEYVELYELENKIIIQVNVKIFKDDISAYADYALYYQDKSELALSGNPKVYQKENLFEAREISLNTKTKAVSLRGSIKGHINPDALKAAESQNLK